MDQITKIEMHVINAEEDVIQIRTMQSESGTAGYENSHCLLRTCSEPRTS